MPNLPRVATPDDDRAPTPRLTARQARDLAAVTLIVAGTGGLVVVAYLVHVLLGAALNSLAVVGFGLALGVGADQ